MAASRRPPTNMTWIINPDMRGMMYSQDGRETWVVHYQVPAGIDWQKVDGKAVIARDDRRGRAVRDHLRRTMDRRARAGRRALSVRAGVSRRRRRAPVHAARRARHEHRHRRRDESRLEARRRASGLGRAALARQLRDRAAADRRAQRRSSACAARRSWTAGRCGPASRTTARRPTRRARHSARASWTRTGRNISRSAFSLASATRARRSSGRTARDAPPDTWDTYTPLDRPGARAPHVWLAPGRAAL